METCVAHSIAAELSHSEGRVDAKVQNPDGAAQLDKIGDSGKIPDLLKDSNSKLWSLNDMTLNYFDVVLISDLGMYE